MRLWLVTAHDVRFGERVARVPAETRDEALHQAQALAPRWKGGCWEVAELHGPVLHDALPFPCCPGQVLVIGDASCACCADDCACEGCTYERAHANDVEDDGDDHSDEDFALELADRRCDAARERSCS